VGCDGSQRVGTWWYCSCRTGDRHLSFDDPARVARAGVGRNARAESDAPAGWRPQAGRRKGSATVCRPGGARRTNSLGRSRLAAAVDSKERAHLGRRVAAHGARHQLPSGGRAAA
jgi:hypothetical protein